MKKVSTLTLVETALLVAITLLMGLTPLGTIRTPFLNVSIVSIPIAIAAILIGPKGGMICGLAWGITSMINAVMGASGLLSTLLTVNPFGLFVTAVVARVLVGLCVGLIYKALRSMKNKVVPFYLASVCAPVLNTVFFMSALVLFFYKSDYVQGLVTSLGAANPFHFVVLLVGIQGVIEACAGLVLGGTVSLALSKALHRR